MNILTGHPDNWNRNIESIDNNGKLYKGVLNRVSDIPDSVIPNADIILLCVPGYLIQKTLIDIKPFLKRESIVGSIVSSTGFFIFAHEIFGDKAPLFGFQRVPFISRSKEYGKIGQLLGYKKSLNVAIENYEDSFTETLPIFQLLGENYSYLRMISRIGNEKHAYDEFTKISLEYPSSVASAKVGKGVKSEGELIISGTKGYIYVPAPWWKTDYFEIRYENPDNNQRNFYQLDGEGIRNEIVTFLKIIDKRGISNVPISISKAIAGVMGKYLKQDSLVKLDIQAQK